MLEPKKVEEDKHERLVKCSLTVQIGEKMQCFLEEGSIKSNSNAS